MLVVMLNSRSYESLQCIAATESGWDSLYQKQKALQPSPRKAEVLGNIKSQEKSPRMFKLLGLRSQEKIF
jgi:hypothetical protein